METGELSANSSKKFFLFGRRFGQYHCIFLDITNSTWTTEMYNYIGKKMTAKAEFVHCTTLSITEEYPTQQNRKWDHEFQRLLGAESHWGDNSGEDSRCSWSCSQVTIKNIPLNIQGGSEPHWSGNKEPNEAVWLTRETVTLLMMNSGGGPRVFTLYHWHQWQVQTGTIWKATVKDVCIIFCHN